MNPVTVIRGAHTRQELCQKSGIPYITLSFLERGMVNRMSEKTARALSTISNKPADVIREEYRCWKQSQVEAAA